MFRRYLSVSYVLERREILSDRIERDMPLGYRLVALWPAPNGDGRVVFEGILERDELQAKITQIAGAMPPQSLTVDGRTMDVTDAFKARCLETVRAIMFPPPKEPTDG